MKYSKWLDEWYENYVEPTGKQNTKDSYYAIKEKRLKVVFGEYELSELTPRVLQRYVTDLLRSGNDKTGKGLSANTVNGIVTVIQSTLKLAYETGETNEYTADKIKRPKASETKVSCFTRAEQRKIEKAVLLSKKRKMAGVLICLYTGLRIGELLALTWDDVDLKKCELTVNTACHDYYDADGYKRITELPKTTSSKRVIPIPKQLVCLFRRQKLGAVSRYVVETENGDPVSMRSYQRSFELLLKRAKVARKNFHSLRHTFATRALECGMDVKTIAEVLGHKNANVTLTRYAHSLLEHKREMMNRLGKSFSQSFSLEI